MKSKLIFVPTGDMTSDDWLKYRKKGLGASEVSAVLGLNPYKSSIELFYEKIDEGLPYNVENIFMFMGKEQEEFVARLWEFWDGSEETMMANYRAGKVIRRCSRVNAYVHNPDYPWLFVSLDRRMHKTETQPEGALEIKTISGYESEKWEHKIPPGHVIQVQTQLTVCEFLVGELATLTDGRRFDVLPFEFHSDISTNIIKQTREFWERVTEARKLSTQRFEAQRNFNYKLADRLTGELQQLEPPPDGSDAFANFLKEKYKIAPAGERIGTDEWRNDAVLHKDLSGQIKLLTESKQLYENRLKNVFKDEFDKMTFGEKGFVSWKKDVNGVRRFVNKVKV